MRDMISFGPDANRPPHMALVLFFGSLMPS